MSGVYTKVVTWDRLLSFLRPAFPATGMYGGDNGGSTPELIAFLQGRADLVEKYAALIFKSDCEYEASARGIQDQLAALQEKHSDRERALRKDLLSDLKKDKVR